MNKLKAFEKIAESNNKNSLFRNVMYFIISCIFVIPIFYIAVKAINIDEANTLSTILSGTKMYIYMMAGIVSLIGIIYSVCIGLDKVDYYVERKNAKVKKMLPYVLLMIICGLQIIFVLCQRAHLRYDTLKIFDQAIWIAQGNEMSDTYSNGYFAIYPNNIPLCIVTALLLKIPMLLGADKSVLMLYVQIINCIMISLAYLFTFRTLECIDKKSGKLFLVICLFNPMSYLLAPFYYTHTFSMFFSTGIIYLFVLISDGFEKNISKKKNIYAFLMGILLVLGTKIRATVGIVAIAIIIYLVLNIQKVAKNQNYFSKVARVFGVTIVGCLVSFTLYTSVQNIYVKYDYKETGYPASHWVMLGLSATAGYNAIDDEATLSLPTKDARNEHAISEIKSRIQNMGISGLITHGKYKLRLTWSDGVDDFIDNISATSIGTSKDDFISGQKNDILVTYSHIFSSMLFMCVLILTIVGLILQGLLLLRKNTVNCLIINGEKFSFVYLFVLNLLGGIMFHLIWEAGQVYSISFMCSTMALATLGMMLMLKIMGRVRGSNVLVKNISTKKVELSVVLVSIALAVGLIGMTYNKLSKIAIEHYSLAVKQDLSELCELDRPLLNGEYSQSFIVEKPFNTFGVKVYNDLGNENCSLYKISIKTSEGIELVNQEILGANVFNNDFYTIEFPTITPNGREEYMVTIMPEIVSEVHSLMFGVYNTGNYDIYENGMLFVNGKETNSDLAFKVIHKYQGNYWD